MKILKDYPFLLQSDYGEALDCTLTSITGVIKYQFKYAPAPDNIYEIVEHIAKRNFYNGKKWGTPNICISNIIRDSIKVISGSAFTTRSGFFKGIGFTFYTFKSCIDNNVPVIITTKNIKNTKYKNHAVIVIGYDEEDELLFISDNWEKKDKVINYSDISFFSSINYVSLL